MEGDQRFLIWIYPICWIYVSWFFVQWINESFIPSVPGYSILIPYHVEEMYKTNIRSLTLILTDEKRKRCQIRLCLSNHITMIIAPQLLKCKLYDNWRSLRTKFFFQISPFNQMNSAKWILKFWNSEKKWDWTQDLLFFSTCYNIHVVRQNAFHCEKISQNIWEIIPLAFPFTTSMQWLMCYMTIQMMDWTKTFVFSSIRRSCM